MPDAALSRAVFIVPTLRYRDAPRAIEWLKEAFGFEAQLVVPEPDGKVTHAQLVLGDVLVMLATVREDEAGGRVRAPADVGATTQGVYVVVADPDAYCERARAAGAEITSEPEDQPYGGRVFTCMDFEGHTWGFGSYDPRAQASAEQG